MTVGWWLYFYISTRAFTRTDLGYVVMFAQFTQFLVKLANFILVRFTRHALDHLTLARPSVGTRRRTRAPPRFSRRRGARSIPSHPRRRRRRRRASSVNESRRTVVVNRAVASRRVASSRTSFFSFFLSFLCRFFASFATPDAFVLSLSPPRTTLSYAALGIARARAAEATRRVGRAPSPNGVPFGRPDSGWCLDGLHICYSMKCCVLLWVVYMGTNESTRDRALTDRARARDRCRTRARRDAHARALTPARARVKTFPSVRRGGRANESARSGGAREIFAAEGRARARARWRILIERRACVEREGANARERGANGAA